MCWKIQRLCGFPDSKTCSVQHLVIAEQCQRIIYFRRHFSGSSNPPDSPSRTPQIFFCHSPICHAAKLRYKRHAYNCCLSPHIILLKALRPLGYATAGFCEWVGKSCGAWKTHASPNACWILICIALATLSFWEQQVFHVNWTTEGQQRDGRNNTSCRSMHAHMPSTSWSKRGDQRGERERERRGEGGIWITNQQLQLATGWHSFAYPHASFISVFIYLFIYLFIYCQK